MNTTTRAKPDPDWPYSGVCLTIHNIFLDPGKLTPTPSALDNLDEESELDLRILGCELIQDSGILLKLPQVAMATAQVLYQRFFYSKSFVRHHYEHYSMACIYLAAKIEENPRRIRDVINVFHHMRIMRLQKPIVAMLLDQDYFNLKNQVIKAERRILKELGFCVHGKHPHKLIICYLQALGMERNHNLVQISWNYMNDSLRTDVFVRYYPETIACACIFLAARQLAVALPNNPAWWEMFHVSENAVHIISLQLLRLYARDKPNIAALESKLSDLRKAQSDLKNKISAVTANNGSGSGTNSAVKGGGSSPAAVVTKLSEPNAPVTNATNNSKNSAAVVQTSSKLERQSTSYSRGRRSRSSSSPHRDRNKSRKARKGLSPSAGGSMNGVDNSRRRKPARRSNSSSRSSSRHKHKRRPHRTSSKKKRSSKKRVSRSPNRTPKAYKHHSRSLSHSRSRSKSPPGRHYDKKSSHHLNNNRGSQNRVGHHVTSIVMKKSKHKHKAASVSSASSNSLSPHLVRKKTQDMKRYRNAKSSSVSSLDEQQQQQQQVTNKRHYMSVSISRSPNHTTKVYKHRSRSLSHSRSRSKSPPKDKKSHHLNNNRSSQQNRDGHHKKTSIVMKKSKHKHTAASVSSASSNSSSPHLVRKKTRDMKRYRNAKSSSVSSLDEQQQQQVTNKRHYMKSSSLRRSRSRDRKH